MKKSMLSVFLSSILNMYTFRCVRYSRGSRLYSSSCHGSACILFSMCRYKRWAAYGQSKLANILHANELMRRLKVLESKCTKTWSFVDFSSWLVDMYFLSSKMSLCRMCFGYPSIGRWCKHNGELTSSWNNQDQSFPALWCIRR